jgi:cation transport ATPase
MLFIAEFISVLLSFSFVFFHCLLIFGAPFGEYVLGGLDKVLPVKKRIISGIFSILFLFVGLSFLQRINLFEIGFPNSFVSILLILYTIFLGYAIIANGLLTKSKKEKYLMTPLSVLGFVCSIIVLFYT